MASAVAVASITSALALPATARKPATSAVTLQPVAVIFGSIGTPLLTPRTLLPSVT